MYEKKTLVDETMLKIYTDELIKSLKGLFAKRVETSTGDITNLTPDKAGIIGVDNETGNIYISTGTTFNDWVNITDVNAATKPDIDDIMNSI